VTSTGPQQLRKTISHSSILHKKDNVSFSPSSFLFRSFSGAPFSQEGSEQIVMEGEEIIKL